MNTNREYTTTDDANELNIAKETQVKTRQKIEQRTRINASSTATHSQDM